MKKALVYLLVFLLVLSLAACGNNGSEESTAAINIPSSTAGISPAENNNATPLVTGEQKILIAYFSRVGNTDFDSNIDAVTSASLNLQDSVKC
ncbi:hypothetical protein [Paenibacillus sp. IHBB 3054]|uniref:hypothetical protein n=1 Tax=Paenibacillus sp. IHBB 3054 TaxID=3425689 RepID=UPI003F671224